MCVHPRRVEQARSSTSFVDNAIDLSWQNFLKSTLWDKLEEGSSLRLFQKCLSFLKTQHRLVEESFHAETRLDSTSHFDTMPACEGQTDAYIIRTNSLLSKWRSQGHSYYRASIATRGHNHYENREPAQHADAKLIRCCHSQYCAFICQWDLPDFD